MQLDINLVFAAIAGAGTVLGTIATTEKYISGKFKGAVLTVLRELEYDREIRHLKRELQELQNAIARVQDQAVDKDVQFDDRLHRVDSKMAQVFNAMNGINTRHEKLETAARLVGAKVIGEPSVSAIFAESTKG